MATTPTAPPSSAGEGLNRAPANGKAADGAPAPGTHLQDKVAPKAYPAPPQLATPTDLKPEQVQAVVDAVNPLIADSFALYTKTKNFHWHLSGSHFRDYHLLFDKQATQIFESIDVMAERLRKIGGTTIRSVSHIAQLQTINDDNDAYVPPAEMVRRLMLDNRHIAQQIRKAAQIADDNDDIATSNELETILDQTERRTWFLYEITQGGDNAA